MVRTKGLRGAGCSVFANYSRNTGRGPLADLSRPYDSFSQSNLLSNEPRRVGPASPLQPISSAVVENHATDVLAQLEDPDSGRCLLVRFLYVRPPTISFCCLRAGTSRRQ